MKKLAFLLGLAPLASFAAATEWTDPTWLTDGIGSLQNAATGIVAAVAPFMVAVGLVFLGPWLVKKIFRYFRGSAR